LLQRLQQEDAEQYNAVLRSTAYLYTAAVEGLTRIAAQRDETNQPTDFLPPVLPHELVNLRPFDFAQIVSQRKARLKDSLSEDEIIEINEEFEQLRNAYRREHDLKLIIDTFDFETPFAKGWRGLVDRFPRLCRFVGGLASVFPGTSTVEADFSVIGWQKDDYRTALTNFSLEGILQCKQYEALKLLCNSR